MTFNLTQLKDLEYICEIAEGYYEATFSLKSVFCPIGTKQSANFLIHGCYNPVAVTVSGQNNYRSENALSGQTLFPV